MHKLVTASEAAWDMHVPDMEELLDELFEYFLPCGRINRGRILFEYTWSENR